VHGLSPQEERVEWRVLFRAAYRREDLAAPEAAVKEVSALRLRSEAKAIYLDCEALRLRSYRSQRQAQVVNDCRPYEENGRVALGAFTPRGEKPVGYFDEEGRLVLREALPPREHCPPFLSYPRDSLILDPFHRCLLHMVDQGSAEIEEERSHWLPLDLRWQNGAPAPQLSYHLCEAEEGGLRILRLTCRTVSGREVELARAAVTADNLVSLEPGYAPTLAPGCLQVGGGDVFVLTLRGRFSPAVATEGKRLRLRLPPEPGSLKPTRPRIAIDGRFDDWRSVPGVDDPRGDKVHYLDYNPDTDILQFKIANDDSHLFLYSRVAGRHGNSGPQGRYYWYTYIDADRDPTTGYSPTRDDDCYFGVDIGDDCEAQFEFVGGRFIKTFFGFTGVGTEAEVLRGRVRLGPSWYSPYDEQGRPRDRYKVEYVRRGNRTCITEDYTEGTSEDIVMALSPDGSEVEMAVEFSGFLADQSGRPLLALGQSIDAAVGAEATCELHGGTRWGADSSPVIYGYTLR